MSLGSQQGVTDLCGSTDTSLIDRQLIISRGLIEDILTEKDLSLPTSDSSLSHAANLLTCGLISVSPGQVNPRSQFKVDGFERSDSSKKSQPDDYFDDATSWINRYLARQGVTPVGAQYRVPLGISVVGRTGRNIGEYEEQE